MRRIDITEPAGWKAAADAQGFNYAEAGGKPYWVADAYYELTPAEVTRIGRAAEELHGMCMCLARDACGDRAMLERLGVPEAYAEAARSSLERGDPSLHGRFDFVLDSQGVPRMLEYNADTPTAIFEASSFQGDWFQARVHDGGLPLGSWQANYLGAALSARLGEICAVHGPLVLAAHKGDGACEDWRTATFIADACRRAGYRADLMEVSRIRRRRGDGRLLDAGERPIDLLWKLYPWEYAWHDEFGPQLADGRTVCLEPAWKMAVSTKGILPVLWQRHPGHPNLLAACFEGQAREFEGPAVCKPLHSREGCNVEFEGHAAPRSPGPFNGPRILQQACPPGIHIDRAGREHHAVIGAWIVGDRFAGIGIREDDGPITTPAGRFVPHAVIQE